jgi:hypothetical protein
LPPLSESPRMALSASTAWEVRTTGADTNGGGFVAGSTGTDYCQQDAAQVAVADAVANGTTTLTSATAAFTAAMVGNIVYLTGGSGSLAAVRRQVVTYTNATTIVLDASVATGTGITLNLGGALASPGELASTRGLVANNKAWIRCGTYRITAGLTFTQTGFAPSATLPPTRILGYKTTRGDITFGVNTSSRPTIVTDTAGITAITLVNNGWELRNLILGSGTQTLGAGISTLYSFCHLHNCSITAFTAGAINFAGSQNGIYQCEITGGTAGTGISMGAFSAIVGSYIHDSTGVGISTSTNSIVLNNLIANQAGAASDGIQAAGTGPIIGNTVYHSGRHGINATSINYSAMMILGNLLTNNGGYGLTSTGAAGTAANPAWDGNAFYSNTSGSRNPAAVDDTSTVAINGVSPYTNLFDITASTTPALTVSPFTSAGAGDFTLNNTAGGGASVRGNAPGNSLPGSTPVGYRDFGAFQHLDNLVTMVTTFIEG